MPAPRCRSRLNFGTRRLGRRPIQCAEPTRKLLRGRAHGFRKRFDVRLDTLPRTRDADSGNDFAVAVEYRRANPPDRRAPFSAVDRVTEAPGFSRSSQDVIGSDVCRIGPLAGRAPNFCDLLLVTPGEKRLP